MERAFSPSPLFCGAAKCPGPLAQAGMGRAFGAGGDESPCWKGLGVCESFALRWETSSPCRRVRASVYCSRLRRCSGQALSHPMRSGRRAMICGILQRQGRDSSQPGPTAQETRDLTNKIRQRAESPTHAHRIGSATRLRAEAQPTNGSSFPSKSLIFTRSCSPLSRWRRVTVSASSGPFSPQVSKSMVTPKGVPTSSWRA